MKFGIDIINAGHFGDPRNVVEIAQAAEAAGWDGFFIWDHLAFIWNGASADPWVTLAGVAALTEKMLIGPMITPVARRRPLRRLELRRTSRHPGGERAFWP